MTLLFSGLLLWSYIGKAAAGVEAALPEGTHGSVRGVVTEQTDAAGVAAQQRAVGDAISWAWQGYKNHAWGSDELRPLSRSPSDWFGLGITIVDSLDTLWLAGLEEDFAAGVAWVDQNLQFEGDRDVNTFETTIRVLGGLLAAYHLSGEQVLLARAEELGKKLSAAFGSPSGVPYSDVNLRTGRAFNPPKVESSLAEVATLSLEFKALGAALEQPRYGELVDACMQKVAAARLEWTKANKGLEGLAPVHISPTSGRFKGSNRVTMGARGDSYFEYLLKTWLLSKSEHGWYLEEYREAVKGIRRKLIARSKPNGLLFVGEISMGDFSPKMDHLACFLPGTLALGSYMGADPAAAAGPAAEGDGDGTSGLESLSHLQMAKELMHTCYLMYKTETGLAPEITHYNEGPLGTDDYVIHPRDAHSILRPETVESLYYLYWVTLDNKYREWGWEIFQAIEKRCRVDTGGYAGFSDVEDVEAPLQDKMESFFLSETLKYLWLLFGAENQIPFDEWTFNTEAHPLPVQKQKLTERRVDGGPVAGEATTAVA